MTRPHGARIRRAGLGGQPVAVAGRSELPTGPARRRWGPVTSPGPRRPPVERQPSPRRRRPARPFPRGDAMATTREAPHEEHPAKPDSPTDIRKPSWVYVTKRTLREFMDDNCTDLAAGLTYYAVLSLFPALIALVSILSLIGEAERTTNTILNMFKDVVPESAMKTLESGHHGPHHVAGARLGSFPRSPHRPVERVELRQRLRPCDEPHVRGARGPADLEAAAASCTSSPPCCWCWWPSPPSSSWSADRSPRPSATSSGSATSALTMWNIAKWPALLLVTVVVVALLYHFTPNVKQPRFRWISLGAVIAIVTAGARSPRFGFYASQLRQLQQDLRHPRRRHHLPAAAVDHEPRAALRRGVRRRARAGPRAPGRHRGREDAPAAAS